MAAAAAGVSVAAIGLFALAAVGLKPVMAPQLAAVEHPALTAHMAEASEAGAPVASLRLEPMAAGGDATLTVRPLSAEAALSLTGPQVIRSGRRMQCAIYARERTGVSLTGAARGWWTKAEGVYRRMQRPEVGAIVVMDGTASGHVAVVSAIVSDREVLIDHANWLGQGEIITSAPMVDVSADGDWSAVRVWHPPTNGLGLKAYPVHGFIAPERVTLAQTAG